MPATFKQLATLTAGAFLGAGVKELFPSLVNSVFGYAAYFGLLFVFLFLGFGTNVLTSAKRQVLRRLRRSIGILSDMGWDMADKEISSWTQISPKDWKTILENATSSRRARLTVQLIDCKADFGEYLAIIDPYGGVYPESNLRTKDTMSRITEYVANGGIFVSIADIPGYYAYSDRLGGKVDTTPPNWNLAITPQGIGAQPIRIFARTPFIETLGLNVLNVESTALLKWVAEGAGPYGEEIRTVGEIDVQRVVVVERNVRPIIKPKKLEENDVTPFFSLPYDNGLFLLSMVALDRPQNHKMQGAIAATLISLVADVA